METTYRELIYYDPDFKGEHGDFNGPCSPLDEGERLDFLRQYARFIRSYQGVDRSEKAVTEAQVKDVLHAVSYDLSDAHHSAVVCFPVMHAYKRDKQQRYKGWQLYTDRAAVCDNTIAFTDGDLPPVPAAAYTFGDQGRLTKLEFRLWVSPEYEAAIPGGILDQTTGRTVELRAGIQELVKLQIYSNGQVCTRIVKGDPYHHKNLSLATITFGEWHTVQLILHRDTFDIGIDGKMCGATLPLSAATDPDILFFGGGMVPQGSWKIEPVSMEFGKTVVTDFFEPVQAYPFIEEDLGEVKLPFALGTYANRDKDLILRSVFIVSTLPAKAVLAIDALDPGGRVYINGSEVLRKDNFLSDRVDITAHLREGVNQLEIQVDPRAPEVLYSWHRHKDPYNGWFCLGVKLCLYNTVEVSDLRITTLNIQNGVTARVTAQVAAIGGGTFHGKGRLYLKRSNSNEKERCIHTFPLTFTHSEQVDVTFSTDAALWSTEDPTLYEVRLVICDAHRQPVDDILEETGFRTIEQKDGKIFLNGERVLLNGALIMQFLPPYDRIPINHVCPSDEQIVWQAQMVHNMNGNLLRLHMLGYGTNDPRFARLCDRMGMMLIWTTRCIDSIEGCLWRSGWKQRDAYVQQMGEVINHPSIIMWEGSNEFHPSLEDIDSIYDGFTEAVRSVDTSRLICPISHLYYAGGLYDKDGCAYYNDTGTTDQTGAERQATTGWTDPLVVRSAHTYCLLLGYGTDWATMREQDWRWQPELFESDSHAYMVTEFAVIGMQDPTTPEAAEYIKTDSYELPDYGDMFDTASDHERWLLSQAFQALCAKADIKQLRLRDVDGMTWCCLTGGANDASYLKPIIDFYGYAKLGFYALQEGYRPFLTMQGDTDVVWGCDHPLTPVLVGDFTGNRYRVTVTVTDENGNVVTKEVFDNIQPDNPVYPLPTRCPSLNEKGYYTIEFCTQKI